MSDINFYMDNGTKDFELDANGNLPVARGSFAIAQHARQRVQTFFAEWFLDTSVGVKWISQIFSRKPDIALAESLLKREILMTPGVRAIDNFRVNIDLPVRHLDIIDVRIITDHNEMETI